jgi:hypothetical protein
MFKISTAKGDWDAFNAGAYGCKYGKEPGKAVELEAGYTENIVCPWPGDYRIEVSGDLKTITLTTDTPNPNPGGPTKVYLRGEMNGWGAPAEWEMTYAEGSYYFNCTGEQMVLAGQTFKIADANWTEINYGVEEGAIVIQDDVAIWEPNGKDAKFEADWNGGMKFTIQEDGTALQHGYRYSRKRHRRHRGLRQRSSRILQSPGCARSQCRERSLHSKAGQQGKQSPREVSNPSKHNRKDSAPRGLFYVFNPCRMILNITYPSTLNALQSQ